MFVVTRPLRFAWAKGRKEKKTNDKKRETRNTRGLAAMCVSVRHGDREKKRRRMAAGGGGRGLPLAWRAGRWGRCEGGSGRASASRCPRCRRYGTPAKGRRQFIHFPLTFQPVRLAKGSLKGADLCSQAAVGTHSAEGEQGLQEGRGQLPADTRHKRCK